MFASLSTDIGSDLPLWAVQDDFKAGVSTVDKFFGGWTKAYAKQYHLGSFAVLRKYCQSGLLTNYLPQLPATIFHYAALQWILIHSAPKAYSSGCMAMNTS